MRTEINDKNCCCFFSQMWWLSHGTYRRSALQMQIMSWLQLLRDLLQTPPQSPAFFPSLWRAQQYPRERWEGGQGEEEDHVRGFRGAGAYSQGMGPGGKEPDSVISRESGRKADWWHGILLAVSRIPGKGKCIVVKVFRRVFLSMEKQLVVGNLMVLTQISFTFTWVLLSYRMDCIACYNWPLNLFESDWFKLITSRDSVHPRVELEIRNASLDYFCTE